jgi:hypothetical protein
MRVKAIIKIPTNDRLASHGRGRRIVAEMKLKRPIEKTRRATRNERHNAEGDDR